MNELPEKSQTSSTSLPLHVLLLAASEEGSSRRLRRTLRQAAQQLRAGQDVREVLEACRERLPDNLSLALNLGLQTGDLEWALKEAVDELAEQRRLRDVVTPFLWYAAAVLTVAALVACFVAVYVVQDFKDIFQDFGVELPLATVGLVALSDLLVRYWHLLLALLVGVVALVPFLRRWPATAPAVERLFRVLPLVGPMREAACLGRFCRTLSILLRRQLPLPEALRQTAAVLPNDPLLSHECRRLADAVEKGVSLDQAAAQSDLPPHVRRALQHWQEPEMLSDLLSGLADLYSRQAGLRASAASVALGPCLVVLIGLFVGFVVLGVFLPLIKVLNELT